MGLFTADEKQAIWRRLKLGYKTTGAILAHTMQAAPANLRNIERYYPEMHIQARALYRMVQRGLITDATTFDRVAKHILQRVK